MWPSSRFGLAMAALVYSSFASSSPVKMILFSSTRIICNSLVKQYLQNWKLGQNFIFRSKTLLKIYLQNSLKLNHKVFDTKIRIRKPTKAKIEARNNSLGRPLNCIFLYLASIVDSITTTSCNCWRL
jgi:hypothetical protein